MSVRKKLEDKFIRLTTNIGNFDWSNRPSPGTIPFGDNVKHEATWAALSLLMEIDKVMDATEETIDWFNYQFQITDNHRGENLETLRNATFRIATWLNQPKHFFEGYDNIDRQSFVRALGAVSSYNQIPILLDIYGIEFEDTLDIVQRSIVPGWIIIQPMNKYTRDVRQALIMFVLYKFRIITEFTHYKNEN